MKVVSVFADYFSRTFRLFFLPDTDLDSEKYRDVLANDTDREKYFDSIRKLKNKPRKPTESTEAKESTEATERVALSSGETLVVSG